MHFLNLADVNNVVEIFRHTPGSSTSWRDIKSYGDFVYTVCDVSGSDGLLIFDMSTLPDSVNYVKSIKSEFVRAHNMFIDEPAKRLYICGANSSPARQGLIVYDLTDPINPLLLAETKLDTFRSGPVSGPESGLGYIHDLFVKNNIVYGNHGTGGFWIWDFTNPNDVNVLGGLDPDNSYNHSSWMTKDNNHLIYANETYGRPLHVMDITDLDDLDNSKTFKNPLLAPSHTNNLAHNPLVKDDLLYVSYYMDGVQIWNINDLMNPRKVAHYDTYPSNTTYPSSSARFNGCWGVYPFLSDNKVIASDRQTGFYLLQLDNPTLPLEFINFSVEPQHNAIQLQWETTSETEVDHFEIQKSHEGLYFESIGEIAANNNINLNEYIYTDFIPATGVNYYRIKSVDTNGATQLTNVERVDFENTVSIKAFPNPTNGSFTLVIPDEYRSEHMSVQIRNLSGRLLYQHEGVSGIESIQGIVTYLLEGVYLLEVIGDDTRIYQERLVVIQ